MRPGGERRGGGGHYELQTVHSVLWVAIGRDRMPVAPEVPFDLRTERRSAVHADGPSKLPEPPQKAKRPSIAGNAEVPSCPPVLGRLKSHSVVERRLNSVASEVIRSPFEYGLTATM